MAIVYAALIGLTWFMFRLVPPGFIPTQDKLYLIAFAQLPDAASLDRTEDVIRRMSDIGLKNPGVDGAIAFPGLSIKGFTNSSNAGIVFFRLKPFEERKGKALSGPAIAQSLNQQLAGIQDAYIGVFPPPPVAGLGTLGGFALQIEDRANLGYDELYAALQGALAKAYQTPQLAGVFSSYTINVPQITADVDRVRTKEQGVALTDVFEAMQVYLGSLYVNDFNRFGRTYQVIAQADAQYRARPEDIRLLKTRNSQGQMVPLGSLVTISQTNGPDRVLRYNGYLAADVNGGPAPGFSSGQALRSIAKVLNETLPNGVKFEWTDLTYQETSAGNTTIFVFPLCVLFVFLVLAALYESWALPLAIILIVPMCHSVRNHRRVAHGRRQQHLHADRALRAGGSRVQERDPDRRVRQGASGPGADARGRGDRSGGLRLRPILMTSLAFIMGVVPLAIATGAGAEMRRAIGIAVFSGMLGVTVFGLFLTPVFYVIVQRLAMRLRAPPKAAPVATIAGGEHA